LNIGENLVALVNTVGDKKSKYTVNPYKLPTIASELQKTIGRPITRDFKNMIKVSLLLNCPVI